MDIQPENAYDDITDLAALICETSVSLVSLIDDGQLWFKSMHGIDADQTPRMVEFCEQTITRPNELFVVSDARRDNRFDDTHLLVDESQICFYAGVPLVNPNGDALGTLSVIDQVPHELTDDQQDALWALSRQVVAQIELSGAVEELKSNTAQLRDYQGQLEDYQRQLELTNARLRALSVTDDLTGLNNRFAFAEELRSELRRARQCESPLSLLFLDADHFKLYNDEFGHPAGDDALRTIAVNLKENMRSHDFVARIGGDEFVIILPRTTKENAEVLAEGCLRALRSTTRLERPITLSIGISSLDGRSIDTDKLITEADQALYHSKTSGRNQVSRTSDITEQDLITNAGYVPRILPG